MKGVEIKKLFQNKAVRYILICVGALILLLLVWKFFFSDSAGKNGAYARTDAEERLCTLLEEIDGVKKATVMITETDGKQVGAVIVFDGTDSLLTRIRVIDVTAAALNVERGNILVYASKN